MSVFSSDEPLSAERHASKQSVWTPMRLQLRSWFRANAESLTPAYEGAVEILGDARFPGRTNFIAHAVRDIANRLPFALDQQLDGKMVQYANRLDDIEKGWKSPKQVFQPDSPGATDRFTISMNLAQQIDKLVEEHRESRKRPGRYELLFRVLARKAPSTISLDVRTVKAFKDTSRWFVEHAHFPERPSAPVEASPDMAWYDEYHQKASTNAESLAADRQNYVREWQFSRLHWIYEHLSGKWRDFYQEMLSKFGEPFCDDLNSYHSSGWGFDSPFTVEELSAMSFAEVIQKIDAWEPGQKHRFPNDPQKEGLADTFGQYVAGKAEDFSAQAELLKDRQPIYVRTFIDKMTDAVTAGNIDIGAILRLCAWVVEQPIGEDSNADRTSLGMVDRNWQYTRDNICRFLRTLCERAAKDGHEYIPFDFREAIIALLERLTRDPAKSYLVNETERTNLLVYDFLTSAINAPRGKAVDALIAYVRWVARHLQREEGGRKVVPNGLGGMPEVQRMLEWQIAAENACFESFAIIGTYLGRLHWIDPSWVENNVSKIFDLTRIERDPAHAYGWAAWNAFLVWGQPNVALYRMLRPQYGYAVERLPGAVLPQNAGRTPLHHLGEQLILLYGRGNLAECNDETLLHQFLEAAPSDVRSQTIAFVGHSLDHSEKLPEAILLRFQRLWDWYWPKFGTSDAKARPQGGLFGQWFTSKQFPDGWSLERLEQFLQVLPIPDFAEQIAERLTELAETHIETVTRILDRMIRADEEGWRAYAWHKSAETILGLALQGNDNVRGMAVRLIDDLGRRGYVKFGNLLSRNTNAPT